MGAPASLWWAMVTLTTVGYGDSYPVTIGGRAFTAVVVILGLGVIAIPTGIVAVGLVEEMAKGKQTAGEKEAPAAVEERGVCPKCGRPFD